MDVKSARDKASSRTGSECSISGWGDTDKNHPGVDQPNILKAATIRITDFQVIYNKYIKIQCRIFEIELQQEL